MDVDFLNFYNQQKYMIIGFHLIYNFNLSWLNTILVKVISCFLKHPVYMIKLLKDNDACISILFSFSHSSNNGFLDFLGEYCEEKSETFNFQLILSKIEP